MQKFFVFLVFTLCLLIPIRPVCGADSTTFNPTTVAVIAKGTSSIPVGTIISWPVAQNPADWQNSDGSYNWLECNGQSISKTVYPELFALVGGQTPDLRGLFLRGHGSHTSTHYGTVTHKSAELGQVQGDAIREIWGSFPELIAPGWGTSTQGAMYYGSPWASGVHRSEGSDWSKRGANFYASRVTPVDGEIRPVNQAVRYLIRAR